MCQTLFLQIILSVLLISLSPARGQPYLPGCGVALQDLPNPSSDSCTSFYRCHNNRQFSLRCPLGQAFHFDRARCRPENEVDCPLQLQRFQAPAVPPHLRSPQDRDVEVRVVHLAPGVNPNNLQFYSNGRQVQVTNQHTAQRGGHTLIAAQQQQQRPLQDVNIPQTPVLFTSPDVQSQPVQGQVYQGQVVQGHAYPIQPVQGQVVQGHVYPNQPVQGQVVQGHVYPSQPVQGQTLLGQPGQVQLVQAAPAQTPGGQPIQGQPAQGIFLNNPALAPAQG
ncbi:hypothetical protein BsWGS_26592 [Bradybaena similaris]